MLHLVTSGKSVEEVGAALSAAAAKFGFGIIGGYDFQQKMAEKGVPYDRPCRVFDVCNPTQAKRALEADQRVATLLPCRIALYQEVGATRLAALSPAYLAGLFGSPGLQSVADQVDGTILAIMRAAAGVAA